MITNTKNINPDNAPRKIYPVTGNKALAINLNPERYMPTASTDLQAEIVLASRNLQAFGATSTSHPPTTPKIASGSSDKTLIEQLDRISAVQPMPHNFHKPNFELTPMISVANAIGDHTGEDRPKEPNQQFPAPWEQHIHYNAVLAPYLTMPMDSSRASSQSSELQLALPALPSTATVTAIALDTRAINQSTSTANMLILSKEIAFAAPIVSPGMVCWNATDHAFRDPCHIHSTICQIDNLTPSSKTFVRKYASTRAFQIPIKIGAFKAHALIDTGAQCSLLSSGLIKRAFDKQLLQLPICGKIKVAHSAVVNAHGPVVVTMESAFGEHMIKCVIPDNDGNDQCIMGTDFLAHPDIYAILNFKENYIQIQDVKLPLKKDAQYTATEEHQATFGSIEKALMSSPLLCYPVYNGKAQFVIQPDPSTMAMGAILYQESRYDQWVIACNSHVLTDAGACYSTT
uniref:Reverse transcriptase/retrotransposon-derived protein RNase H-like domain-containing protein n=1 Tax=Romanomermis culicivorax TaxID=13658 RepID=A0A915I3E0_ROMCU